MSLPPLPPQSNLINIKAPLSVIPPAGTVGQETPSNKTIKVPIESLQTLIHQLKITTPTLLTAKVEASGKVPQDLLSKLPTYNTQVTIDRSTQLHSATSQVTTQSTLWSKIRVASTLNLLITYPSPAHHKNTPSNNPLLNTGSTLSILVSPNSTIKIVPDQAQPTSTALTNAAYTRTSNTQAATRNILSALSQLTDTLQSQQKVTTSEPVSHLLNKLQTLSNNLTSLSPAIGQQLVPRKLLNTLMQPAHTNPLRLTPLAPQAPSPPNNDLNNTFNNAPSNTHHANIHTSKASTVFSPQPTASFASSATPLSPAPTPAFIEQLTAHISQHSTAHQGKTIQWLQQGLALSQQLLIPERGTPLAVSHTDLLTTLLGSLPSAKRSAMHDMKESRHTLARWLTQELTQHITRTASGHIHNHAHNLERSNEWQQHIDIPLRWGDEFGNAQVRIEQKEGQHNKNIHKATAEPTNTQWEIAIDFELPQDTLKPQTLSAHLKLQCLKLPQSEQQQTDLSVAFWSQAPALNRTIEARLSQFKQQLSDIGLNITQLSCHTGAPPLKSSRLQHSIIDIKT
ncbi:hypothetical protein [Marinagarivorans algicola]|uniref:hypothetical protein n=1 Tax=Marinagarivorans algicola TaxID=1513270 RepID=UPI0006B8E8BB|nr:hypothetical protein [Marinagarivorans algicola]